MKKWLLILLFLVLLYTRFVGLDWGLPYPMHPDERNIADAVTQITLFKPYSPSFWAYGGLPINITHLLLVARRLVSMSTQTGSITFLEALIMLRIVSATVSIGVVLLSLSILKTVTKLSDKWYFFAFLLLIFSPGLIQTAHFGTTESLLTLFFVGTVYTSLKIIKEKNSTSFQLSNILISGFFIGGAIATKASAALFIFLPLLAIFSKVRSTKKTFIKKFLLKLSQTFVLIGISLLLTIVFSPHYLLFFDNFKGSLLYEAQLVKGAVDVFYTKQFLGTLPIAFQVTHIFPYILGLPVFIASLLGFFRLTLFSSRLTLLRFALLLFFIPNAFLFAKWARYMVPLAPLMIIFALLFLMRVDSKLKNKIRNVPLIIILLVMILPGAAYLSVYQEKDVRFKASDWIYTNIPEGAHILSETANVIDIPLQYPRITAQPRNYKNVIFNHYDVDYNSQTAKDLDAQLMRADYIIIPSRRIFANFTCESPEQTRSDKPQSNWKCNLLHSLYPVLNKYYQKLFSGEFGFKKVVEITSYPKISLFGKTLFEFPDEAAEETWTVFDHPVIRVYKRVR